MVCIAAKIKKIFICSILPLLASCASPIPSNYLSTLTVHAPQHVQGHWKNPRIIPVNAKTLDSPQGQALLAPAMYPKPYRIGTSDTLNIIVWGHPELSSGASGPTPISNNTGNTITAGSAGSPSTFPVQSDGTIFFPFVKRLVVANLTIRQVEQIITTRLSRYIRNPEVSVQIVNFRHRNIYVLGEVKNPGLQPITDRTLTLMEAITTAGNIDPSNADPHHIYLIRGNYQCLDIFWFSPKTPQALTIATAFPLQENDIVFVSSAEFSNLNRLLNQVLPPLTLFTILTKV